jgi:hypothetical protein
MNKAEELLGQMVDLAVKFRRKVPGFSEMEAFCVYCGDSAGTPPKVLHKHNCIVARSRDFLNAPHAGSRDADR